MGIEDRDYFRKRKEEKEKNKFKNKYVDEDGNLYDEEEWFEKNGKSNYSKNTYNNSNSEKKGFIEVNVSTEDIYFNKIIDVYFKKKFYKFTLNSRMKDKQTYSSNDLPFGIKLNIMNKEDYTDFKNNVKFEILEIDTDLAKFGGEFKGVIVPSESQNEDVLEIIENNKTRYITLKIIDFNLFEEKNRSILKKTEITFKNNWIKIMFLIAGGILIILYPWIIILGIIIIIIAANN